MRAAYGRHGRGRSRRPPGPRRRAERQKAIAECERLRELERWRAAFLDVMAHELRTPLGQVLGFLDLLAAETDRLSSPGRRYLANARQAGGTLEGVVQRALDVLDLLSAEAHLAAEPASLVALAQLALAPYATSIQAKAVTLTVMVPEQPVEVRADGRRLHQAIAILVDNAVKFVPAMGSIAVTVTDGASAELRVWNSGPGVPASIAAWIFGQGVVEGTPAHGYGGVGLSLLLARRIADLHGGSLRLDPSEGGARFVLTLPAASPLRGWESGTTAGFTRPDHGVTPG